MIRALTTSFAVVSIWLVCLPAVNAADSIDLTMLDGKIMTMGGKREKPIYLKFWATWCKNCLKQMPHLEAVYKKYHTRLDVVAVNFGFNDTRELIKQFQQKSKLTVPIALEFN